MKKARKAEGIRARKVWLSDADMDVLKARYPGPRGGVDWTTVICAALNPSSAPAADNGESNGYVGKTTDWSGTWQKLRGGIRS